MVSIPDPFFLSKYKRKKAIWLCETKRTSGHVNSQFSACDCTVAALQQLGWAKYLYKYDRNVLLSLQQSLQIKTDAIPISVPTKHLPHAHHIIIKRWFAKLSFSKSFDD